MDEKELKTSGKQRVFIIVIAVLMLGSMIASYAAIIINGASSSNSNASVEIDANKVAEYEATYKSKAKEFSEATKNDYDKFIKYKSDVVKAYNEASANENGLKTRDLVVGSGRELKDSDKDYLAYYIGWCADEKIFDASFDDTDNPTGFAMVLEPTDSLIEGWKMGIAKMKIGGIREITIPSDLAYKDQDIACGPNKPLKFLIMTIAKDDKLMKLSSEVQEASIRLQYAQYGIDYDSVRQNTE